ncbi:MAG: hypothetical protein ACK6DP_16675 [Gemmatimonas sp.]|jgi:hypothetical protein|uniref:hypothetical protein n=1 Tax=Gemmatimonas sp. TaxID=1962908 RepID=UPI00391FC1FC|nr:hypothetical protein [Gemmatimonadota bacterium]
MLASTLFAVAGVFGIGLIIGLVVLTTAEEALTAVARTAARDVSGSFWAGVLTQLLAVPALVVLVIACAITVIGILAIPIAVLAWALALSGAVTLGTQAVVLVIGRALAGRGSSSSERGAALRGLTVGLIALSLLWFGAALAAGVPVAGALARLVAVAFTWAMATVGLGAVVKSRIGVARVSMQVGRFSGSRWASARTTMTSEVPVQPVSWQTPTPVQGVVAARRPVDNTSGTGPGAAL